MNKTVKNLLLYIGIPIILLIAILSVSYFSNSAGKTTYYDVIAKFQSGEVVSYTLNLYNGDLDYVTQDGKKHSYTVPDAGIFYQDFNVIEYNEQHPDAQIKMDYENGSGLAWIVQLLPTLILVVVMFVVGYIFMKRMSY